MAQSIRISDRLYEEAHTASGLLERSLAQQIEHWARLGQALEITQQLESESINLRLKSQFARDRQRVASGQIDAADLAFITPEMARASKVTFSEIDYAELTSDYI